MAYCLIYIAAIVAANLLVAAFGPVVTPINAFFLIGLDLALRDMLHVRWAGRGLAVRMLALIAISGAVSYAVNPATGSIALASMIAFVVANVVDAAVFAMLFRCTFVVRSNASNVAGALVDSILFPTIAFGTMLPAIVAGQFAAKVAGGAIWAYLIACYLSRKERAI